jgi:hypothetical protein
MERAWSWGRGWAVYDGVECDVCGHSWTLIAAVGGSGQKCPKCGRSDPDVQWAGDEDEPPNDGAWIEGHLAWIGQPQLDDEDEDDEDEDEDDD